jgi:hypothetical protein
MDHFCCDCCNDMRPLDALLDLDCHCSICTTCCEERLRPCMVPVKPAPAVPAAAEYAKGDIVRYVPSHTVILHHFLLPKEPYAQQLCLTEVHGNCVLQASLLTP